MTVLEPLSYSLEALRRQASQPYRAPISKELWKQLEPLIPPFVPSRKEVAASAPSVMKLHLTASCTCYKPEFLGRIYLKLGLWERRRGGAREWNAAGVWAHCITPCSLRDMTKLIEPSLMALRCPRGPKQAQTPQTEAIRLQATHHRRCQAPLVSCQWCKPA